MKRKTSRLAKAQKPARAKPVKASAKAPAAPPKRSASATPTPAKTSAKKPKSVAVKPAAKKRASAEKAPPRAKAKAKKASPKPAPVRRRDALGRLDPKYAADLRAQTEHSDDDNRAFFSKNRAGDDLAEELGEEFIETATTGEYEAEDLLNQSVPEDRGGPFVPSTAGAEFASGRDKSNPKSATREPFPKT